VPPVDGAAVAEQRGLTWVVGDVHGCADELGRLLERLRLDADDRVVVVGDLFHRGPDAWGVVERLRAAGARFVLGNHELCVLRRAGLAPARADASDRPPLRTAFPALGPEDLAGDGRRPLVAPSERLVELLVFLQAHDGCFLEHAALPGAGPTADGRPWCVVHAGVPPGKEPAACTPEELVYAPRARGRRGPFWYERYRGPTLVVFGHQPRSEPLVRRVDGRLVALGLDTGCVYGGRLSAYCPEEDRLESVAAARAYARS